MRKGFFKRVRFHMRIPAFIVVCLMILEVGVGSAAIVPPVGLLPLNQITVPEPPNLYQFVKNKTAAIMLGKAFFWDMQVGSDGATACATCHFHAGTDNRLKNTVNPGTNDGDTIFQVRGPNETLQPTDFPFHQRQEPVEFQASPFVRDSNDVVGSQGVRLTQFVGIVPGSKVDNGAALPDPLFQVGGVNVRQVTGRNTPSVINAVFNFANFWDGRASPFFNGVNPFGPLDATAGVWFNLNGTLVKQPISMEFASLASQATGPPLSEVEMSFRGRTFPQVGRKMLGLTPLGGQFVHPEDSELGFFSRATLEPDGSLTGERGLNITYSQLIRYAFQDNLWNSNLSTSDGFTQMEANFSLFWGLAIQLYEATLISDDTPFDRFLGGDETALTDQQQDGFNIFFGGVGRCDACHGGTELSMASVRASGFVDNTSHALIELMNVASGKQIIYDNGFNNTAVRKTNEDTGRGGDSLFINALDGGNFIPLSFCALAELQAKLKLPFAAPILPGNVPPSFPIANDGAFKVPSLRNIELTAPYMHNGGMMTLHDIVDFYVRGGDFPNDNKANLDINIDEIPTMQTDPATHDALVAFMQSLTDERVRNEEAPFDHPEIFIPNGDSVNNGEMIHLPATGVLGLSVLTPLSVSLAPNVASPQTVGTPITFTATRAGGQGIAEFRFWINSGTGFKIVRNYSADSTFTWTPSATGAYDILVDVRIIGSTAVREASAKLFYYQIQQSVQSPPSSVSLVPSVASPQAVGTPITFTAQGSGGSGPNEYRFWLNSGSGFTIVQNYSTDNTWTWTPSTARAYDILVDVRNVGSSQLRQASNKIFFYQIQQPTGTAVTLSSDLVSPQTVGSPITFTATGSGSPGPFEYRFWLNTGSGFNIVRPYDTDNTWVWTPGLAGNYDIMVDVRTVGSTDLREAFAKIFFFQVQ